MPCDLWERSMVTSQVQSQPKKSVHGSQFRITGPLARRRHSCGWAGKRHSHSSGRHWRSRAAEPLGRGYGVKTQMTFWWQYFTLLVGQIASLPRHNASDIIRQSPPPSAQSAREVPRAGRSPVPHSRGLLWIVLDPQNSQPAPAQLCPITWVHPIGGSPPCHTDLCSPWDQMPALLSPLPVIQEKLLHTLGLQDTERSAHVGCNYVGYFHTAQQKCKCQQQISLSGFQGMNNVLTHRQKGLFLNMISAFRL